MIKRLVLMAVIMNVLDAVDLDDDESTSEDIMMPVNHRGETIIPEGLQVEALQEKDINCHRFSEYALNCTVHAAMLYNSSRKAPPLPTKMTQWCAAIKYLTECAMTWNYECNEITDSHFNEESIQGHTHVVKNICDDENFLARYDDLPQCIEGISRSWEACYTNFKSYVDDQKNTSKEWTHYQTHFLLCCARSHFRRCTLDIFFNNDKTNKCSKTQALTLQRFSVVVSEGDVFQDCDRNVQYSNCPGGDPRPSGRDLTSIYDDSLSTAKPNDLKLISNSYQTTPSWIFNVLLIFIVVC